MAASDHLSERQFGPAGKYTSRRSGYRSIEAVHTGSGRRVGAMNWLSEPLNSVATPSAAGYPVEPGKPTIFKVVVSKPARRKGVATAMLAHAREIDPGLQHSHALSPEGAAWAKARP